MSFRLSKQLKTNTNKTRAFNISFDFRLYGNFPSVPKKDLVNGSTTSICFFSDAYCPFPFVENSNCCSYLMEPKHKRQVNHNTYIVIQVIALTVFNIMEVLY